MIQTGLIQSAHNDLVADASYDFYGLRLATCSLDQRIKIWQLDESTGVWNVEDDWKAHDAPVTKVSWAHPEFGSIIASSSFDRTVKVWEQASPNLDSDMQSNNANGASPSRWIERAVLPDARESVRAVEFAPHHFGLKLATISTDNFLRIYECLEQPSLTTWQLSEEIDVLQSLTSAFASPGSSHSRTQTMPALATPTQTNATLDGAAGSSATAAAASSSATSSLVTQALQHPGLQTLAAAASPRPGGNAGNREADGGWCISWCKDRYWGEIIAAGAGITGVVKIVQFSPSRRPYTLLTLDPHPSTRNDAKNPGFGSSSGSAMQVDSSPSHGQAAHTPSGGGGGGAPNSSPYAITSVAWAPSCGRSYHLIATGGRDGHVRIWRVTAPTEGAGISRAAGGGGAGGDESELDDVGEGVAVGAGGSESESGGKWSAVIVADFEQHRSAVTRVEWNITGTVLSSAGNDGRIRLWKATFGNVWRTAGSIGVEQSQQQQQGTD